jgi:hypothetical protein
VIEPSIDVSKFITALRLVVNALPLPDEDRAAFLEAIEQRAAVAYRAKQSAWDKARPPRSRNRTRAQLDIHAAHMRRYRAAKKAQAATR